MIRNRKPRPPQVWRGFRFPKTTSGKGTGKMALDDLIAKFESFTAPGDGVEPDIDAVLSGVTEVYNSDISVRDQAVKTYKEKLEKQEQENSKLKQANYDLLMKQPQTNVGNDNGGKREPDDVDESERAATIKVADLFTKRK